MDGQPELLMPLTVYGEDGRVQRPDLGDGDPVRAFEAEIAEVVRCVQSNQPSQILSGTLARDAIAICHKQTESVQNNRSVTLS